MYDTECIHKLLHDQKHNVTNYTRRHYPQHLIIWQYSLYMKYPCHLFVGILNVCIYIPLTYIRPCYRSTLSDNMDYCYINDKLDDDLCVCVYINDKLDDDLISINKQNCWASLFYWLRTIYCFFVIDYMLYACVNVLNTCLCEYVFCTYSTMPLVLLFVSSSSSVKSSGKHNRLIKIN
jgi:hypothetical protein